MCHDRFPDQGLTESRELRKILTKLVVSVSCDLVLAATLVVYD